MDGEWVNIPVGTIRVGRERAVRLSAGMNEPLAPAPGKAMYSTPVTFWWRERSSQGETPKDASS